MKMKYILSLLFILIVFLSTAQAEQLVAQGQNVSVGINFPGPYKASGYEIGISYDPTILQWLNSTTHQTFRPKTTYAGSASSSLGNAIIYEFVIGNGSANINGTLVSFNFKALKPTAGTDIYITEWLLADENGLVGRDFVGPLKYETIKITGEAPVPTTYAGLMILVAHFANPAYDLTGDGRTDLEDFVKLSRQIP